MLDLKEYVVLLNDAIKRNETIVFSCKCTVHYSGRAESYLEKGDRVVIIKADNTILVHQPKGNNPINYMKQETSHKFATKNGKLQLRCSHLSNKEFMDVIISRMYFFNTHKLEDGRTITVSGTEKDMSDMLYEHPDMIEKGFTPISREEQTKYGFIDVFGYDKENILTVVECKRFKADLSAVSQLRRYVGRIKKLKGVEHVRGILAAPKITSNAKKMLEDWGFSFVVVHPPKYHERFDKKQSTLEVFG
jgi:endonuclease